MVRDDRRGVPDTDRRGGDDFIYVRYQGSEAAAALIEAHFGDPPWLHAERDGPLPWADPRGDLDLIVTDEHGRPIPELWCEFTPLDRVAEDGSETIWGTDHNGRCTIKNLPAVAYEVNLHRYIDNDHYGASIKSLRVIVTPNGGPVRVVVEPQ